MKIYLPAEVWERVAEYLPLEDRCTLSCTSLVLSSITRPFIFGNLRFGQHSSWKNSLRRAEALTLVRPIQQNIRSITFHLYYANLSASSSSGTFSSSTYANGTSRVFASKANAALLKALPKLPRLDTLVIAANHIPSHSWSVLIGLPTLNHLELYSADEATPAPIPAPLPKSYIKSLTLRHIDYASIANALLAHLAPTLEALQLTDRSSAENLFPFSFPPFPKLHKFIITGSREAKMQQGALLRLLVRTPPIMHLEMNQSFHETPLPETSLPNLESITLYSASAPSGPTFSLPRTIDKLTIRMTGEEHTEQSTEELLSSISEDISASSVSISGRWAVRWAIFYQLQWSFRNVRIVHLELSLHVFSGAADVSLPVGLPRTVERITVELRHRLQGYKMAHIALPNHASLRDWPEALIASKGNEALKRVRLEVWRIWDAAVGSRHDEPGWWKEVWRVEGAEGGWRMDTSSEQGFNLDKL